MQLLQIFIPLRDNAGQQFTEKKFLDLRKELMDTFGGVTVYIQSPVSGVWKETSGTPINDELIIYEVMADDLDPKYCKKLKNDLERIFRQEEILMRYYGVTKI